MKHAIITGASSGIGFELAKQLVGQSKLTLIARNIDALHRTKEQLYTLSNNENIEVIACDVRDKKKLKKKLSLSIGKLGVPTHLYCSAGLAQAGLFLDSTDESYKELIEVNYLGTVNTLQCVLPLMEQRHKNHVVIISSTAGLIGLPELSAYSASKFALIGLSESIRYELEDKNIYLSVALPPNTKTPQLISINAQKSNSTVFITSLIGTKKASVVARKIIEKSEKRKFMITFSTKEYLLLFFLSLIKPILRVIFKRIIHWKK